METDDLLKISFNLFIDEEAEDKNEKKPVKKDQFKPASTDEEWFMKQPATSAQTIKFKADLLYSRKNYIEALEEYKRCFEALPLTNRTLRRDVYESIVWTLYKMNKLPEARLKAQQIVEASHSDIMEQMTSSKFLSCEVSCDDPEMWEQLLSLHPLNVFCWMKLAKVYLKIGLQSKAALCFAYSILCSQRHQKFSSSFVKHQHESIETSSSTILLEMMGRDQMSKLLQQASLLLDEVAEYKETSEFIKIHFPESLISNLSNYLNKEIDFYFVFIFYSKSTSETRCY